MTQINVIEGDKPFTEHKKIPVVIILDRLRSVHNVGNILRLADAVNAEKVVCAGYTACPPHPKLSKSAMGAEEIVETEHFDQAADAAVKYKKDGYEIIAVETVAKSENLWDAEFNSPIALIFGNEALGIQEETLNVCDRFISLPSFGLKNSINVSNCASVILYKAAEYYIRNK
jgi:23S rRNA (guanosine2251-2'-O)-methyltransferase